MGGKVDEKDSLQRKRIQKIDGLIHFCFTERLVLIPASASASASASADDD